MHGERDPTAAITIDLPLLGWSQTLPMSLNFSYHFVTDFTSGGFLSIILSKMTLHSNDWFGFMEPKLSLLNKLHLISMHIKTFKKVS